MNQKTNDPNDSRRKSNRSKSNLPKPNRSESDHPKTSSRLITSKLLGLDLSFNILRTADHADYLEVFIVKKPAPVVCPHCSSEDCIGHGTYDQRIRHKPCCSRPVVLTWRKRRFLCKSCNSSFYEQDPFLVAPNARISNSLDLAIRADLMKHVPIALVAERNFVSSSVVLRILDSMEFSSPYLPRHLAIDEFKADTDAGKYNVVVVDGDNSWITDILPERTRVNLDMYFKSFDDSARRRVRFVTCDMYSAFINSAHHCLPNATICIDKFHVVRLITDAFQEVRRRADDTVDEAYRTPLKRAWKLLLKHKSELDDEKRCKVTSVLTTAELRMAYALLQAFYDIVEETSYAAVRDLLTKWIISAINSEISEFVKSASSIRHWKGYILNGFKFNKTNAIAEGTNNKIKVLKRVSFGFRSFESLRKRCLVCFGPARAVSGFFKLSDNNEDHPDDTPEA